MRVIIKDNKGNSIKNDVTPYPKRRALFNETNMGPAIYYMYF